MAPLACGALCYLLFDRRTLRMTHTFLPTLRWVRASAEADDGGFALGCVACMVSPYRRESTTCSPACVYSPSTPATIDDTMDMISEPSTDHQNPLMTTPTSKNENASHDASSMNSQLMTRATNPRLRMDRGSASTCTTGLMDALISAMNSENAAIPRIGGSPFACMPGNRATITPAAMVIISQLIRNRLMGTVYRNSAVSSATMMLPCPRTKRHWPQNA